MKLINRPRDAIASLGAAVLVAATVVLAAPANAATTPPPPPPASVAAAAPGVPTTTPDPGNTSPGYKQAVRTAENNIAAAGDGGILGITYTPYTTPTASSSAGGGADATNAPLSATSAAVSLPSDCGLTVVIYYTHRTTSKSSVYNDSTNYCPGATHGTMDLYIAKEDTVWGSVTTVASGYFSGSADMNKEIAYYCPTGNISGFQAVTYSSITYAGKVYPGEAYDGTGNGGYTRYSCG